MTHYTLPRELSQTHWLTDWEKQVAITALLEFGLLKWSNKRNLPLKSGGKTDVYINLRDARNSPAALRFFANLFSHPLQRLHVDRVAEIPQAATCFSGIIATNLNKPLVTIRHQAKVGRVSDANIIGEIRPGELIGLYDDVISDGMSKFPGYQAITSRGAKPVLVVGIDREQGWQASFKTLGIDMPVWAGMTLHDVRSFLITKGLMERCSEEVENQNQVIVALDGKSWNEILPIVDRLRTTGVILKVNDLLVDMGVEQLLPMLSIYGKVMVDLKSHDTPNTVANVCRRLARHKPWACTVHASGGPEMVKAASHGLFGFPTKVLAVTLLTSIDSPTGVEIYNRGPRKQVRMLANLAWQAGAQGFVCSPEEVSLLRSDFPEAILVTPGVRSVGVDSHDQKRVGTPAEAIRNGASFVVCGRQIVHTVDPVAEVMKVQNEIESVS